MLPPERAWPAFNEFDGLPRLSLVSTKLHLTGLNFKIGVHSVILSLPSTELVMMARSMRAKISYKGHFGRLIHATRVHDSSSPLFGLQSRDSLRYSLDAAHGLRAGRLLNSSVETDSKQTILSLHLTASGMPGMPMPMPRSVSPTPAHSSRQRMPPEASSSAMPPKPLPFSMSKPFVDRQSKTLTAQTSPELPHLRLM